MSPVRRYQDTVISLYIDWYANNIILKFSNYNLIYLSKNNYLTIFITISIFIGEFVK